MLLLSAARQTVERMVDHSCLIFFVSKFDTAKSIQRAKEPCAMGMPCFHSSSWWLQVLLPCLTSDSCTGSR